MELDESVPERIRVLLRELDLIPVELLFISWRKDRYNFICEKERNRYFVKVSGGEAPDTHREKFQSEVSFYRNTDGFQFLPKLVSSTNRVLVLEYVENMTLRRWLIEVVERRVGDDDISREFETVVANLCDVLSEIYFDEAVECQLPSTQPPTEQSPIDGFLSAVTEQCNKLILSGPKRTNRSTLEYRFATVFGRIYTSFLRRYLKYRVTPVAADVGTQSVHGDLHQDNLLVSQANDVFAVDWEDSSYGSWIADIAFLSAIVAGFLQPLPLHREYLLDAIERVVASNATQTQLEIFNEVRHLMYIAVSTNRRFHARNRRSTVAIGYARAGFKMLRCLPATV